MICVKNDAKADARCHTLKIDIWILKCTKIDAKEEEEKEKEKEEEKEEEKKEEKEEKKEEKKEKEEVSGVISVENDEKVDARCHTLKIDIRYLKCTKIDSEVKHLE